MTYDELRRQYKPSDIIRFLLIAESPPPTAETDSSRHFYRADRIRRDDRLFVNTIRALYPETEGQTEAEVEQDKETWLRKFQADGWYMIEALEDSQKHEATKKQRQSRIAESLPKLLERVKELASPDTKIILIKSNVFDVAAEPLRRAGYNVLNTGLVDYPGRYNQQSYRNKLRKLFKN